MARSSEAPRVGGGGAATSAGIVFEQKLGALIGAWLLADQSFDQQLRLGDAKPIWLRFETEAPIDDILVATSTGGFIAIQAKTTASLSTDLKSPFGKTISQFVRHWLACRDGDGRQHWNRPLDAARDRLVLAVGRQAPTNLREALPSALRLRSQPGGAVLTGAQRTAYEIFASCVEQAWSNATSEAFERTLPEQLARLMAIFVFDPEGADRAAVLAGLGLTLRAEADSATALATLEVVSGEMMALRGGADLATLRQALLSRGVSLAAPPNYDQDIAALKVHSNAVADALQRYEVIEASEGNRVSITRECQPDIQAAALEGSLLIVGEPGSGKSGVLNALARDLRELGHDVLELAVDRYSVESLEGLKNELRLQHALLDVLDAWDGVEPAWLVIDALDATRGGKGERVFRTLIEQILERKGRWRVIASIRTFDLRMGQQFRSLFKGSPPVAALQEQGFAAVRHVRVPVWSETEFRQLLASAPALSAALSNAPQALRDLAIVPFNTRLLSDLIKDGVVSADFSYVASQAQLLQLYWSHRVQRHGAPANASITRIAMAMVDARELRAPVAAAAGTDPVMLDVLAGEGVIVTVDNGRWVQFRHHLLFDFAASRVLLDPGALVSGALRLTKEEARGLMLAPALTFVLREIWESDADRSRFWRAAARILADQDSDPVVRSSTGRICAEYPLDAADIAVLAERVIAGDGDAQQAFMHTGGALAIRLEDHPEATLAPWVKLLRAVASNPAPVAGTLRFLLFKLVGLVGNEEERRDLGHAARALLSYALGLASPRNMMSSAIDLVAGTFETNPVEARALLAQVFEPARLEAHGWEEVPALCRKIEPIARTDPGFAIEIYGATYGFEVNATHETRMGESQIMSFTSNARQDYDMARYALVEFAPKFLAQHPDGAVDAIVDAVGRYVDHEHPIPPNLGDHQVTIDDRPIRLREDRSHIWAHDPDSSYGHDAEALVKKLLEYLREAEVDVAVRIANRLIDTAGLAIFWSRLFMVAAERDDGLIDLLLPFASTEPFLMIPDTRKDAVDVVAKGYDRLSYERRVAFEDRVGRFDFSDFARPDDARESFLRRLFGAIGLEKLATDFARTCVAVDADRLDTDDVQNDRPFVVRTYSSAPEPFDWIDGLDHQSPVERVLMDAIEAAKHLLGLDGASHDGSTLSLQDSLTALSTLAGAIDRASHDRRLVIYAEGIIGQGLSRLINRKLTPREDDVVTTGQMLDLLRIVSASEGPTVEADTERTFEQGASWGSPAPRVEAAEAVLDITLQRPDLFPRLEPTIDVLLADPHPAVRLQAGLRLVRIWDVDREGFWRRLSWRLVEEANLGVLDHVNGVLGRVLHPDPERTESLALALLERFVDEPERHARVRKSLSDDLAILWVSHQREAAHAVIHAWMRDTAEHHAELTRILGTLRGAFVIGLSGEPSDRDNGLRRRSLALALEIVDAASENLRAHYERDASTAEQMTAAREDAQLIDTACRELYFATGVGHDSAQSSRPIDDGGLTVFFREAAPTLHRIGDYATPHTVYYLLQLLERLLPIDPERAFDLMAHALRSGGQRSGYQFESLGADLLVRLVGVYLVDHKELFEDDARRATLIDCLEIFMDAGWPAARRLLYRLPEFIQ